MIEVSQSARNKNQSILSIHSSGPDVDDLMGQTSTDAKGRFQVSGKTSELTTIDVQLKIYHDCDDGWMIDWE
jgi:hypothetical protein